MRISKCCPFCGLSVGNVVRAFPPSGDRDRWRAHVVCACCECRGPTGTGPTEEIAELSALRQWADLEGVHPDQSDTVLRLRRLVVLLGVSLLLSLTALVVALWVAAPATPVYNRDAGAAPSSGGALPPYSERR